MSFVILACMILNSASEARQVTQTVASWRLSPEIRIGNERSTEYALTGGRQLVIDGGGSIFVPQLNEDRIRVFDARGNFVRYVGRSGSGPGEFRVLRRIGLKGDTLWATEERRLHLFRKNGESIQTLTVNYPTGQPYLQTGGLLHVLRDGTIAAQPGNAPLPGRAPSPSPLFAVSRDGHVMATLGYVDYSFMKPYRVGGRNGHAAIPFYVRELFAFAEDGSFVVFVTQQAAEQDRAHQFRIVRVNHVGDTVFTREVWYRPVPVTVDVRDSVNNAIGRLPSGQPAVSREIAQAIQRAAPVPRFYPPVRAITVGADSTIWLGLHGHSPRQWLVLDKNGSPLARVVGTNTLDIRAANATHAWGIERNELDVPTIVRFRIERRTR